MRSWSALNTRGRILYVCCIINLTVAVIHILNMDFFWIFSSIMAMFCGLMTYSARYDRK